MEHSREIYICFVEVALIGSCLAFQMKRCSGMTQMPPLHFSVSPEDFYVHPPIHPNLSDGHHVDSRCLRNDVTQLVVNVHGGFVEVETIAEYSGYTDHNGHPLLWSHDVEFVVDNSGIFHDQNKGIYTIKVVRFHRANVFAKWRLARRNPIIKAMQSEFIISDKLADRCFQPVSTLKVLIRLTWRRWEFRKFVWEPIRRRSRDNDFPAFRDLEILLR